MIWITKLLFILMLDQQHGVIRIYVYVLHGSVCQNIAAMLRLNLVNTLLCNKLTNDCRLTYPLYLILCLWLEWTYLKTDA